MSNATHLFKVVPFFIVSFDSFLKFERVGKLLGFLVRRVLAAELAILHEFQSVRVVFLVFLRVIVSLLALGAGQSNFDSRFILSHLAAPPI